jgi:hypothetical protein
MALWRDPLDELTEDLEKALPPEPPRSETQAFYGFRPGLSFTELQFRVREIFYGRNDDALIVEAEQSAADGDGGTSGNAVEEDNNDT